MDDGGKPCLDPVQEDDVSRADKPLELAKLAGSSLEGFLQTLDPLLEAGNLGR
jgi:hypothetical protein